MPRTYEPIATTTVSSATVSDVTFSTIPGTYTDLITVISGSQSSLEDVGVQFNGDTASNYSITNLIGNGSSATSGRQSNQTVMLVGSLGGDLSNSIFQFMNYSNTTTNKTVLNRSNSAGWATFAKVGLWRSTAAITSIKFIANNNFVQNTVLTLYGIKAA